MSIKRGKKVKDIEVVEKRVFNEEGFLRLWRMKLKNLYEDGSFSREYTSDMVHRRGMDSVAIIPYFFDQEGKLRIFLKRGIRPAVYFRKEFRLTVPEPSKNLYTYEAIAGSLEEKDRSEAALFERACEELFEELGLRVRSEELGKLGAAFYPSHGQSSEKVHLLAVPVRPGEMVKASGDGSVNEEDSITESMEAAKIIDMCEKGEIEDPKLEIGVSRLCKKLRYS